MINRRVNGIFVNKTILLLICLVIGSVLVFGAKWVPLVDKPNWDYSNFGQCDQANYCFVGGEDEKKTKGEDYYKTTSQKSKPKCVDNEEFIKDYYCDSGEWTTRTKLLALELLNIANTKSPNEYTLFCGPVQSVSLEENKFLTDDFTNFLVKIPRINTACVLKYSEGTALAFSANSKIDNSKNSILNLFSVSTDSCNNAINSASFEKCNVNLAGFEIYYNNKIKGLLYLPKNNPVTNLGFAQLFKDFFEKPFQVILNYVTQIVNSPQNDYSFFNNAKLFQQIFVAKKGTKEVFAFLEKTDKEYLGIKYSGVGMQDKTCEEIIKFVSDKFECTKQPVTNNFVLVAKSQDATKYWPELTASLRIK